jgi:hypothetical protein
VGRKRAFVNGLAGFAAASAPGGAAAGPGMLFAAVLAPSALSLLTTTFTADPDCSLYVGGRKKAAPGGRMEESLTAEQQIERLRGNPDAFVERVSH